MTIGGAAVNVMLLTAFVSALALLTVGSGSIAQPPRLTTAEIQTQINDLFTTARYDSILALIPGYIQRAEAERDTVLLGRMLAQRGRVLTQIGRGAEGVHDIDRGLDLARACRDTIGWMPAAHYKGYYYTTVSRYDEAMRYFEERKQLAQIVNSPLDEAMARTSIGYVYLIRGDYTNARENYTRAVMLFRRSERPRSETAALGGLARIEVSTGHEREARAYLQRAWVVDRLSGNRLGEMWGGNDLGALEAEVGDPARSAAYSQRAFDIAKEIDFPKGMVIAAINLAARAKELGNFPRADSLLTNARHVCLARGVTECLNMVDFSLAELRLIEDRYAQAGVGFRRLLNTPDKLEPQHRFYAVMDLAEVLEHADSIPQAIELMAANFKTKGVDVYALAEPSGNLYLSHLYQRVGVPEAALRHAQRALACAQRLGFPRMVAIARLRESGCYRARDRRREAYESLLTGLDSLDTVRGGMATPEWREVFGQKTARDIVDAGRILLEYPDDLPEPAREAAFFDNLQRFKTRSLLDRISQPHPADGRLALVSPPASVTKDDLQHSVLQPRELLLEFFVGSSESYLAAITTDVLRLVKLPGPGSPLAESIDLYHQTLANPDMRLQADFPPERLASIQQSIGAAVLADVGDLIEGAQRVLIAPDGFFASVPFATLRVNDPARMLMETTDVVQIPSASVLALQRARPRGSLHGSARIVALEAPKASRLPGAHDEVRALARQYAGVRRLQGLPGGVEEFVAVTGNCDVLHVATHALVVDTSPWQSGLRLVAEPAPIDSMATPTRGVPRESVEILSAADSTLVAETFPADPFVRAWQIAAMALPQRLTVLAGCETAGGRRTTGEGVLGLTSAFVSAGVPVVVSSLWPVDDRATVVVMRGFYAHLARGEPVATALRLAQLEARREPGRSHPFYWAGFAVVGDGSLVVPVKKASRVHPAVLAVIALSLVGASLVVMRRRRGVSKNTV